VVSAGRLLRKNEQAWRSGNEIILRDDRSRFADQFLVISIGEQLPVSTGKDLHHGSATGGYPANTMGVDL
jgi:hypothetical protein